MNLLFGTAPIGIVEWGLILGSGLAIYAIVGIEKTILLRRDKRTSGLSGL
jgi:hypothetical protein